MPNPITRSAFAFSIFLVGAVTVAYAARLEYETADTSVEPIAALHPVVETAINALPIVGLLFAGFGAIAGVAWLVSKTQGGRRSSGGGFR